MLYSNQTNHPNQNGRRQIFSSDILAWSIDRFERIFLFFLLILYFFFLKFYISQVQNSIINALIAFSKRGIEKRRKNLGELQMEFSEWTHLESLN